MKIVTFVVLNRLIAIFLLLQMASNTVFAQELIKVPRLFTHYYHHAYAHKDVDGFLDFLHQHYAAHHQNEAHSANHNGEDNDCNLPFKHCSSNVTASYLMWGFVASGNFAGICAPGAEGKLFVFENERIQSFELNNIWQPPRLA